MMNNNTIMKRKQILHGKEQATNQNIAVNVLPFHCLRESAFMEAQNSRKPKGHYITTHTLT